MHTSRALLVISVVSLLPAFGQQQFDYNLDPGSPARFLRPATQDTTVDVIVEFVEAPLFLAERAALAASADFYRNRFAQFSMDVAAAEPATLSIRPRTEFYKVFFGTTATVRQSAIGAIERLPYVRRVHREREFSAHLYTGLGQIRVPEAWAKFGVKGEGVVVGIIDSGIDYLHPAMGGGIGPGFKVVGGYDFVNGDPDPMDDNGHGTHVAGIVAADGASYQGVAPKASLLSYKVLSAQGGGLERNIIAAVERAVDPNQDGNSGDIVDIVNMSLGSDFGDPDDALSRAVDNAVMLGVTICVSAGNAGGYTPVQGKENNYYYTGMETIGSPGTARLAITVGAVDSLDGIARFSSKGPSGGTFGVKPDVVAPGEAIWSLAPGGLMAEKSGTSMASPMVAGVAALLKCRDRNLTPAEIKSALMNSALDVGLPVMKQGAGRVDAVRALKAATYAAPGSLSFGLDDPAQVVWTETETLAVVNRSTAVQTYSLISSGSSAGVTIFATPQAFMLAPGGAQSILVTVSVDNRAVPTVEEDVIIHDGIVEIRGTADTLHVPWAFVRTSRLLLAFSEPDPVFLGMGDKSYITPRSLRFAPKVRWIDTRHCEVSGPATGTYDFAVYFPSAGALVTKEQVWFHESGTLEFNVRDAIHSVRFDSRDETGLPFPESERVQRSLRVDVREAVPLFVQLPSGSSSLAISPASTRLLFHPVETYIDPKSAGRVVVPQYSSFRGVTGNTVISPTGQAYSKQTLQFTVPPGTTQFKLYTEIINIRTEKGTEYFNTIQIGIDTLDTTGGMASFQLALMKPLDPLYSSSVAFYVNAGDLSKDYLDYSTRYLTVVGDSVMVSLPSQRSLVSVISPDGGTLSFGGGPVHILNLSYNNLVGPSIQFNPQFRGGLMEERYTDAGAGEYAIFNQAGEKLTEGSLNSPRSPYAVEPGKYRTEIQSRNFFVSNARGTVVLTSSFDLARPVVDAPYITSFAVIDGRGKATDHLAGHDPGSLRFSARIPTFPEQMPVIDSTRAFYRTHKSTDWFPLPVEFAGGNATGVGAVFQASLTAATVLDSAGIDLRIRVVDMSGNASDLTVAPAFAVGPWVDDGTSDVEDGAGVPAGFALEQNYPNPFNPGTTIGYTVGAVSGQSSVAAKVRLAVYDLLGREVATLVDEKKEPGAYAATWDASGVASGVYFCRLTAGNFTATRRMLLLH